MSSNPAVTLTLAGDEKRLTEAFDRVGTASKSMADTVTSSSRELDTAGNRFETMAEHTDNAETRFTGFYDTIGGTRDLLATWNDESLSTTDRMVAMGQAGADLAGGLTNWLIPAIGSAAGMMSGPLRTAMTFISSHPLLIVLGLIVAAVIYLITQTDWFQAVATKVFNWVGNLVKNVFGTAVDWVVDRWHGLVDWFSKLPENIGKALGSLGGFIKDAFKGAMNVAIDWLNWGVDRANDLIYGINVVSPFDDIPYIRHIARMHSGGVVQGMPGEERLILARAGERITPPGQGGGGGELRVSGSGPLAELLQAMITDGSLQLVGR